jgi:ubiquitin C-terminal hydrolase
MIIGKEPSTVHGQTGDPLEVLQTLFDVFPVQFNCFLFQRKQQYQCVEQKHVFGKTSDEIVVPISLAAAATGKVSLVDVLNAELSPQRTFDAKCTMCGDRTVKVREITSLSPQPRLVILHLKRLQFGGLYNVSVQYPVRNFVFPTWQDPYDLVGLVVHKNNHYTCEVIVTRSTRGHSTTMVNHDSHNVCTKAYRGAFGPHPENVVLLLYQQSTYSRDLSLRATGLKNKDNRCYQNAVLHLLSYVVTERGVLSN